MTEIWFCSSDGGRPLAVKTLKPDWLSNAGARALLRREYELLSRLRHPGIVAADAFIDEPDRAALVLEYLGGGDLVSLAGAAPRHWIVPVRDVLAALDYLHKRGFAHRDVKARNVMFDGSGRARLIDFGSVARIGASGSEHGTTAAHRPSAARLTRVTAEQDLHAFAVLLFELLAGRLPFGVEPDTDRAANAPEPSLAIDGADRPDLDALGKLVLAAFDTGGDREIPGVAEFANVIESVLATESKQP